MSSQWSVDVYRFDPEQDAASRLVNYRVPRLDKMTVLDVLAYIQRHHDRSLVFRFACRLGMCGTCTVMVNGIPRWACRTSIERLGSERLQIAPLHVDKYRAAMPFFAPAPEANDTAAIAPASQQRRAIDPQLECITCGACYASCTMLSHDPDYLGPAALNRAFTLVRDSRDTARAERLAAVGGEHGCWRCHSLYNCTEVCPKHISPTQAIKGLKRDIVRDWWQRRST
jgi:fumarate reductase iron-sulfur subunit